MANRSGSPVALSRAIENADVATLRAVLTSMCSSSKECLAEASRLMLVRDSVAVSKKRKITDENAGAMQSRYEVCKTCEKTFDITKNGPKACQTHEGTLEVDPNEFPDDDDIQAGEYIDTETDWRVEEWPEGFVWTCCQAKADEDPCVVGRHVAKDQAVDLSVS